MYHFERLAIGMIASLAALIAVLAVIAVSELHNRRRQRRYRDALARRDWREVDRQMGVEPVAPQPTLGPSLDDMAAAPVYWPLILAMWRSGQIAPHRMVDLHRDHPAYASWHRRQAAATREGAL